MFVLLTASALSLSACVSEEQADAKMTEGCKAAIAAMIEPNTIKEVKSSSGASEDVMGDMYRRITLKYVEAEDFAGLEKTGSCLFSEQWGPAKTSHTAMLEQVVYNDTTIGKKDGQVVGDMQAFIKLTETVGTVMSQK